ncbi:MAG: hypothetical protein JWM36_1467 [Hyphomicrobiales bacterium]|nr:hypothetical protein [Hyphomicrobiales bacterium]
MAGGPLPWAERPDGLVLFVRLTPRSAHDGIDGIGTLSDGTPVLKARVRAVPEKGLANEALRKLLAATAGLPTSRATLLAGDTARRKSVLLTGDAAELAGHMTRLFAAKG